MAEPIYESGSGVIYEGIEADVYHRDPALSSTQIGHLLHSPEVYAYNREHPKDSTPAMTFGSLFHCMLLEPEAVNDRFAVKLDGRTKEGKEQLATFAGTLVSAEQLDLASEMVVAARNHPVVRNLMSDGLPEVSGWWTDGFSCRMRMDWLCEQYSRPIIVDFKTTEDSTDVANSVARYGYHRQAAWYTHGYQTITALRPAFVFVFIEKSAPYHIEAYELDARSLERGWEECQRAMNIYQDCVDADQWHGEHVIKKLSLPGWALR